MRGLAALMVVLYHVDPALVPGGYLAVDFFFALSGFVIARTYDSRLKSGLSGTEFALLRLIRLYPLFLLGLLIGLVRCLGQMAADRPEQLTATELLVSLGFGALLLPSPATLVLFPLNGPGWSLFFEFWINLVYAIAMLRARTRTLALALLGAAVLLTCTATAHGSLDVGYTWATFLGGVARVCFSFTLGVLIARLHRSEVRTGWSAALPCVALVVIMVAPIESANRAVYDLVVSLLAVPALVWSSISVNPVPALQRLGIVIGELSYPLYAVHHPVLGVLGGAARRLGIRDALWVPLFMLLVCALAWLLAKHFDRPVRGYLSQRALRWRKLGPMPSSR